MMILCDVQKHLKMIAIGTKENTKNQAVISPVQLSIQHDVQLIMPWPCWLSIPFPCLPRSFFSFVRDLCHRRRRLLLPLQSLVVPWSSRVLVKDNASQQRQVVLLLKDNASTVLSTAMEPLSSFNSQLPLELIFSKKIGVATSTEESIDNFAGYSSSTLAQATPTSYLLTVPLSCCLSRSPLCYCKRSCCQGC